MASRCGMLSINWQATSAPRPSDLPERQKKLDAKFIDQRG